MKDVTIQVKVENDEKYLIERYIAKRSYSTGERQTVSGYISESIMREVIADLVQELNDDTAFSSTVPIPDRLARICDALKIKIRGANGN